MRPVVLATTIAGKGTSDYLIYWKVLARSVLEKNPGVSCPWVIIHDGLTAKQKAEIKKEYPNVEFHRAPAKQYKERNKATYFSFEIANPVLDAAKIIKLDADMICDGPMDYLFYRATHLVGMVREPQRNCFAAGVIVLNRHRPDSGLYNFLCARKHDGGWGTDQNIWNQVPGVTALPEGVLRFALNGIEGPKHPTFWAIIAKRGGDMKARTTPYVLNRWKELYGNDMIEHEGNKEKK